MTKEWRPSADPWSDCLDRIAERGWCRHYRHMGRGLLLTELQTDPPDWGWMPSKREMAGLNSIPEAAKPAAS